LPAGRHCKLAEVLVRVRRSSAASTTLKIAVFAPIPSARVAVAARVKPAFFRSVRAA